MNLTVLFGILFCVSFVESKESIDVVISEAGGIKTHQDELNVHDQKNPHSHLAEGDIMEPEPEEAGSEVVYEEDNDKSAVKSGSTVNDKKRRFRRSNRLVKRNAYKSESSRWTGGVIPYIISPTIAGDELDVLYEAIDDFHAYTCLQWIERTSQTRYVNITRTGGGCWSWVGMISESNQPQTLHLGTNCLNDKSTPVHEMMHAAGVFHQHSRPDRDSYVTINLDNVQANAVDNFDIKDADDVVTYDIPYSYESVMHYGSKYFSKNNQNTIVTLDSNAQSVIGKSPTFSFEDIELLTNMYNCAADCPAANCPTGAFQGGDCNCYCKSDSAEDPVLNCGEVCLEPDYDCACSERTDSCSAVSNSACSGSSGACECDSGYVNHNKECTLISSITCTELAVDCKCHLNTDACEAVDANSECNSDSGSCSCASGFEVDQINGGCLDTAGVTCDEADKECFCSQKGSDACSAVSNSQCNAETDSCSCNVGYYSSGGVCITAPDCTALGAGCFCQHQAADACDSLVFSLCDSETGACECDTSAYREEAGQCVEAFNYVSNGEDVYPFSESAESTTYFSSSSGTDNGAFGIDSNGLYLHASGTGNGDVSAFESDWLTKRGKWCINYGIKLNNVRVYTMYTYNGVNWGHSSLYTAGSISYFYKRQMVITANWSDLKVKIKVEPVQDRAWSVAIDPVQMKHCS